MRTVGLVLIALMPFVAGCVMAQGPCLAPLSFELKGPVSCGADVKAAKTGRAQTQAVICYAWGDGSIAAAMKDGNITKVQRVESETTNILGIYGAFTTIVYGE